MTTTLSPDTLQRLAQFVEVFTDWESWVSTLPEEEQILVRSYAPHVLYIEGQDTDEIPVVTASSSPGDTPVDTPDLVTEEAASAASSPAATKTRGRPRKTVQ